MFFSSFFSFGGEDRSELCAADVLDIGFLLGASSSFFFLFSFRFGEVVLVWFNLVWGGFWGVGLFSCCPSKECCFWFVGGEFWERLVWVSFGFGGDCFDVFVFLPPGKRFGAFVQRKTYFFARAILKKLCFHRGSKFFFFKKEAIIPFGG